MKKQSFRRGVWLEASSVGMAQVAVLDRSRRPHRRLSAAGWSQTKRGCVGEILERASAISPIELRRTPFGVRRRSGSTHPCRFPSASIPWREDHCAIHLRSRFLRGRIEEPKRFDRLAQKLDPQRLGIGGRENVHDAAANTELTRDFNDGHPAISQSQQATVRASRSIPAPTLNDRIVRRNVSTGMSLASVPRPRSRSLRRGLSGLGAAPSCGGRSSPRGGRSIHRAMSPSAGTGPDS